MCIFCKIVNQEIPSYKIYEDDLCIAFLDISQATIGHCLVVPKKHYDNIFALDDVISNHLFSVTTKISKAIKNNLHVGGINIINNNGPLAGQTVNHFHIHIIPRYENDKMKIEFASNKLTTEEFISLLNKIKKDC